MIIIEKKDFMKEYLRLFFIFVDFLDKNGVDYSLAYGTLLGAYRSGKMIPWDFDIDIMMDYENIKKLNSLTNLPNDFYIKGFYDFAVGHCLTRVYIKKFYQSHGESGVKGNSYFDIFHVRGLKECKKNNKLNKKILRINEMIYVKDSNKTESVSKNKFKTLAISILKRILPSTKHLIKRTSKIDAKMIIGKDYLGGYAKLFFKKVPMFKEYSYIPFEGHKCKVINNVEEYLERIYGSNYMTPINDNRGDDFLFYRTEELNENK